MDHLFDEFSKSLSQSVPRRESLRRLGAIFAGAVLSPLGLETAWAAKVDPCKAFCRCRNSTQQSQCLAACRKCNGNTSRLAGSCGSYTCCALASCSGKCSNLASDPNCGACGNNCGVLGMTCCGNYCADLADDPDNCGACGNVCYWYGACVDGTCVYDCPEGTTDCNGYCANLETDWGHCGACGNVCGPDTPDCVNGVCGHLCEPGLTNCGRVCVDLNWDNFNCGACTNQCTGSDSCSGGQCQGSCVGC